ncbi:hypothetical protein [Haliea sp. E17]|uniref:hypothetical protein n=1 Tax=Haliea sp. E17 TaxID=3401576 RepID=UPI003AACC4C5
MSDDKHTIDVTLDTSATPPVSMNPEELTLKNKKTHKVVWKAAKGSDSFTFQSLEIDSNTYTNPTDKGSATPGSCLSDVDVADDKMSLKDTVTTEDVTYAYVVTVTANGKTYSSGSGGISLEGGSAKIRNNA